LPPSCEVEFSVPEHCNILMHNLLTSTVNYQIEDSVRLLAMFSSAVLKYQNVIIKLKLSGLILTSSVLVILEDNVQWLIPSSNRVPLAVREQAMSNLIAIVSNSYIVIVFIVFIQSSYITENVQSKIYYNKFITYYNKLINIFIYIYIYLYIYN